MSFPENLITQEKVTDEIGLFKNLPTLPYTKEECGYAPPVPSTDPEQQKLEQQMREYMGKQLRIEVIDGRLYYGTFYCYDSRGNIVLSGSSRHFPDGTIKHCGFAIVPYTTVTSVRVKG